MVFIRGGVQWRYVVSVVGGDAEKAAIGGLYWLILAGWVLGLGVKAGFLADQPGFYEGGLPSTIPNQ
jgi:hypothetical protein